ncbi:MAG: alpha/beta fold hydrolase [Planctomycetota bacterium]|nr:alpha/beta fold hydrolase [Planctomycetota bacterium]
MTPHDRTYQAADATPLPMRVWSPQRPRAVVVYLHGIQSHCGWYGASSRHLAEAGVAVYQLERRGSGSDAAHERGHVDRAETWLDDVAAAARLACGETGLAPVHLMGVSWGGKLALACVAHRPELYRSLLLAAPGILPRVDPTLAIKVRVAQSLMGGQPLRRFPIPLQDAMARKAARVVARPTLLALAEKDRIIDNAATRALVEAMPCSRRRVIVYPGASHTLEFEADPAAYFRDLAAWIDEVEAD